MANIANFPGRISIVPYAVVVHGSVLEDLYVYKTSIYTFELRRCCRVWTYSLIFMYWKGYLMEMKGKIELKMSISR